MKTKIVSCPGVEMLFLEWPEADRGALAAAVLRFLGKRLAPPDCPQARRTILVEIVDPEMYSTPGTKRLSLYGLVVGSGTLC